MDFGQYWDIVMGPDRDAVDVAEEFELVPDGLGEWVAEAEFAAAYEFAAAHADKKLEELREHSDQAISELKAAIESCSR